MNIMIKQFLFVIINHVEKYIILTDDKYICLDVLIVSFFAAQIKHGWVEFSAVHQNAKRIFLKNKYIFLTNEQIICSDV